MNNLIKHEKQPRIQTNYTKLENISEDSLKALIQANDPPMIFVMGGHLVRLRQDEKSKPIVESITDDILRYELERAANYYMRKSDGDVPHSPPHLVLKDILAMGEWPDFPILQGVIQAPVLKPNGDILDKPGYDIETKLYYMPSQELSIPEIPLNPTPEEIKMARGLLKEAIQDFPFNDKRDETNMLALLITPFVRPAINGPVPLAIISAPQPGSGKTLLGEVCGLIATGHSPTMLQFSPSEEENRKKITSALLQGDSVIEYDNVKNKVDSGILASALTGNEWADRILGRSQNVRLPQRATWIMNGNNLHIGDELNRRSFPINLTPNESRPWSRQDFLHKNLPKWIVENRGYLIWVIFVLIRHWVILGKPRLSGMALGNFDEWAEIIGGILNTAKFIGFLGNLDEMYETQEEDTWRWENFLLILQDVFSDWFTTSELCDYLPKLYETLPDEITQVLDGEDEISTSQKRQIGKILRKSINRRFGETGMYLETTRDKHNKIAVWRVSCGDAGYRGVSDSEKK
jgi:hypothetical protein